MDGCWWREYKPVFNGQCYTASDTIRHMAQKAPSPVAGNSGAGAMMLARHLGADKIVLIGFDCKADKTGKRHWHADHTGKLGNAGSMALWPKQYEDIFNYFRDIEVINCTRDTDLNLWPKRPLEQVLTPELTSRRLAGLVD